MHGVATDRLELGSASEVALGATASSGYNAVLFPVCAIIRPPVWGAEIAFTLKGLSGTIFCSFEIVED
jgi:hypothetical protein